jgi:hypothetical protein
MLSAWKEIIFKRQHADYDLFSSSKQEVIQKKALQFYSGFSSFSTAARFCPIRQKSHEVTASGQQVPE